MKRAGPLKRTTLLRRTEFKRSAAKPSRTAAGAPRSPRRRKNAEADDLLRREGEKRYARAGGVCERCKARPATQRHHVMRRSNRVDHSEANLRVLCLWCHDHVHREVGESKRLGWIVHENPQIEPRLTG